MFLNKSEMLFDHLFNSPHTTFQTKAKIKVRIILYS